MIMFGTPYATHPPSAASKDAPSRMTHEYNGALAMVREAAERFRETPMPLEACLSIRDWIGEDSESEDPLANAFQKIAPQAASFHTPELQSLIAPEALGGWALCADTIEFLVRHIRTQRPSAVLEFGSGTSSLALAWAMRQAHGPSDRTYVYSIDQSAAYIEKTKHLLTQHGLLHHVRFLQANLIEQQIGSIATACYQLPPALLDQFFEDAHPECVVIDGPAGDNGVRFGTIPLVFRHLAPHASVFLDDGLRDSELDTADQWGRLQYVHWDGMRWTGKGLLCGRLASAPPTAAREWLESALHHASRRRPITPPAQTAAGNTVRVESVGPVAVSLTREDVDLPADNRHSIPRQTAKRCLFLNTYYPDFLEYHYHQHAELLHAPYREQHAALQQACFGDSDFYSSGLRAADWDASDLIVNCQPLQQRWAEEHGIASRQTVLAIAIEQIKRIRPHVLYIQDLGVSTKEFLDAVRPFTDLIVGQIASSLPPHAHVDGFDILISSFPHFVEDFRKQGRTAYYQPLAFDHRVLDRIGKVPREYPLTFVGGLSPVHVGRKALLEYVGQTLPVHCWGYGTEALESSGFSRDQLHGAAWGIDMFRALAQSFITLNQHAAIAQSNANTMRLFEATGCGALLVTDYKDNLKDLFDIGSEIVAYRSPEECRELLAYYLAHPEEAAAIAARGQARTLRDHTYQVRMNQTAELLSRHLEKHTRLHHLPPPDLARISYGHTPIQADAITPELRESWRSDALPQKQRSLVERELQEMYQGKPSQVFQVLTEALRPYIRSNIEVLEIGCASGYYYEVLEYLLKTRLSYVGIDFSEAMIRMARRLYPGVRFEIGDGGALRFQNHSIPIVVSSCVLLHVQHYAMHIAEAARVASELVVLHRTPISRRTNTRHYKKFAYGIETFELRFHEPEILGLCADAGLELITALTYDEHPERDEFETTYVFRVTRTA